LSVDTAPQKAAPQVPTETGASTGALTRRFVRDWVRPHWRGVALAVFFMLLVAATTAAYPAMIKFVVDALTAAAQAGDDLQAGDAASSQDLIGRIWFWPLLLVVVASLRGLSIYAQNVLLNVTVLRIVTDLQRAMFGRLLESDMARMGREATGQLVSRFTNDVNAIRNGLSRSISTTARDAVQLVGLIGVMIWLDPVLSLVVLVVYPIAAIPIMKIGQRMRKVSKRTQEQMGDMSALLMESLAGARIIKTYGLEDYDEKRAGDSFEHNRKLRAKAVTAKALLDPLLEILGGIAVAGVIAIALFRIATGVGTLGDFAGFIASLIWAAQSIRAVGNFNAILQEALAAIERIFTLLDEEPEIIDAPHAIDLALTDASLEFEQVSFGYGDGNAALNDFTLSVPGGKMVALVGRSGAGKSTVFNLIPRLFDVGSGSLRIDGQDVRDVTLASLRGKIGMVSQDAILFNDTVRANIAFGKMDASDEEIIAAAKAAAAHDFIMAMPEGYDTIVGDRGGKLSGGERQRISLARAILKDAPILLLDEATSALDAESERLVQDALEHMAEGRTTIAIAHRLATVRKANLICVMEAGRIVEQGTHEELLAKGGLYAKLAKLQFRDDDDGAPTEASA